MQASIHNMMINNNAEQYTGPGILMFHRVIEWNVWKDLSTYPIKILIPASSGSKEIIDLPPIQGHFH